VEHVSINNLYEEDNNETIIKCLVDNKLINNKMKCKNCRIQMAFVVAHLVVHSDQYGLAAFSKICDST